MRWEMVGGFEGHWLSCKVDVLLAGRPVRQGGWSDAFFLWCHLSSAAFPPLTALPAVMSQARPSLTQSPSTNIAHMPLLRVFEEASSCFSCFILSYGYISCYCILKSVLSNVVLILLGLVSKFFQYFGTSGRKIQGWIHCEPGREGNTTQ